MAKQSAGILAYRVGDKGIEVLIVHPGGPFWAKKDMGAWSIPKGEFEGEDGLEAAKREFQEELGQAPPSGDYQELGTVKNKSGKIIHAWVIKGDLNIRDIKSNTFMLEWPPRSGKQQEFPEVDKAGWFSLEVASQKLNAAQADFIERLADKLNIQVNKPEQTTLL
jgi:predicted NUDIX family NTP pyrophosphohydrolase